MGMVGVAAITLMAASGGTAMGWMMGGTTEAIETYKKTAITKVPTADATTSTLVNLPTATGPATTPATIAPPSMAAPAPVPAFFPANNTIQWATSVAPGQALSGVSVRNGDTDTNLIAHLTARAVDGSWTPVASMTVSPGRESVLRPPAGEYAMQLVASPTTMPYDRIASIPRSPAVNFSLAPQAQGAMPAVRFSVSKGRIDRLPDPTATASRRHDGASEPEAGIERTVVQKSTMTDDSPAPMMTDREDETADARTYTDGSAS
jgi:hypothetical protein